MSKIKFGIIGCGRISSRHVGSIIANRKDAELVAVYDIVEEPAIDKKKQYEEKIKDANVKVYTNYEEFLEDKNIDVVTIASISGLHAEHAIDCLNKEKHVLIEKPMALTVEDADRIIEAGKKNNKKICVSHQNRFIPVIQELKKAIDENRFGKIINGSARTLWNRNDKYFEQAPWRGTKDLDGGILLNQCIHNIDLLQWLLGGEVVRQHSEVDNFIRDIETEDFGAILLRFKNGAIGTVEGSVCVYPKNLEESLSIFGEKGTVVIKNGEVDVWDFEDGIEFKELEKREGHIPLYKDFINSLKGHKEPLVNGKEGKQAIEIINKIKIRKEI